MARKPLPPLRPRNDDGNIDTAGMYAAMAAGGGLRHIPTAQIAPNPNQPRRHFDPAALSTLAESIKAVGLLHPPRVRAVGPQQYELVAGERRLRACQQLDMNEIPVIVADSDTTTSALAALAENLERENLNPIEEASAYATLIEDLGLTKEAIAGKLGKSRSAISNTLRLLDLPDPTIELLASGRLTAAHGRSLLTEPDHHQRQKLGRQAAEKQWSVRELDKTIGAAGRKAAKPSAPPSDQQDAARSNAETLSRAFHRETTISPTRTGGFRLTIDLVDLDDLERFVATTAT